MSISISEPSVVPRVESRAVTTGEVIDTKTNVVEHPRLVAQRIERYADIVGRERVVPGTDCGFGTIAGQDTVVPTVTWAKFRAQAEGARIASEHLWDPAG